MITVEGFAEKIVVSLQHSDFYHRNYRSSHRWRKCEGCTFLVAETYDVRLMLLKLDNIIKLFCKIMMYNELLDNLKESSGIFTYHTDSFVDKTSVLQYIYLPIKSLLNRYPCRWKITEKLFIYFMRVQESHNRIALHTMVLAAHELVKNTETCILLSGIT